MDYTPDFFEGYRPYLELPEVKETHKRVFQMFKALLPPAPRGFVDLGCGTGEFGRFVLEEQLGTYLGIDLDTSYVDLPKSPMATILQGDYTTLPFPSTPVFVSLFSTEIHYGREKRHALYDQLFTEKGAQAGLVSGFYYDRKPYEYSIREAAGHVVCQAVESLREYESSFYKEFRIECRVPPAMFRDNFTEVWKIMVKR